MGLNAGQGGLVRARYSCDFDSILAHPGSGSSEAPNAEPKPRRHANQRKAKTKNEK